MKFNYKKIASVLASAIMLSSTVGFAAAASAYPTPFVAGGTADGAVIVGSSAAISDWSAAIDVQQKLNALVTSGTTSSTVSTTGETAALFTSSSKINVNDTFRQVKTVLTKTELPTVLKDGSFSGNVDATYTSTIDIGTNPIITFAKQPVSTKDPAFGLTTSTSTSNVIYNASITFNKAVNLSHADSEGQEITLFGQKFTIAAATDATDLVLLKSAEKVSLSSDSPTADVTVGGKKYTLELISSSDTSATISVTDEAGTTESKEVNEAASKKINGLTVAVNTADETNLKLSATVIAGAEKVTLTSGSAVTTGDSATTIDGTLVTITGGIGAMTKMVVGVAAKDSDKDALMPGETFIDPVFGTFKVDFSGGLNIADAFDDAKRESIDVRNSGDDKMTVKFKNYKGNEATIQFAKNSSAAFNLCYDDDIKNITVVEKEAILKSGYVMVGNQDEAFLLKVATITNQSSGYSNDKVTLTDVFNSENSYSATLTSEGGGTITIGGKVFTVRYEASNANMDLWTVSLDYPDSVAAGSIVAYPTIKTSKGALIAFYEPLSINLGDVDGSANAITPATQLRIPDGDGYTDTTIAYSAGANWTIGSTIINTANTAGLNSTTITVGKLTFNATSSGTENTTTLYLMNPQTNALIRDPALIIFEEKDDNSEYQALVVTLETGATSTDGIGVDDVIRTWGSDATWDSVALASKSTQSKEADLYGTIVLVDSGDSDQTTATISYPDEQIYAQLYIGTEASAITPGTSVSGAGGQVLVVKDKEVDSVKDKNLFVVGGSCINEVAAKILGKDLPVCGDDFSALTKVSAGGYIIKTVESPYNAAKVAMLVAGYNADDTTLAVAKALTGVATDKDSSTTYPEVATA